MTVNKRGHTWTSGSVFSTYQSISEWEGWPILISTVYVHSDCDAVLPIAEFFLGKYLASSRVQCHISLFCLINWILSSRKGQQLMQSEWSEKSLSWFVFGTLLLEVHKGGLPVPQKKVSSKNLPVSSNQNKWGFRKGNFSKKCFLVSSISNGKDDDLLLFFFYL